jgi:uncharacterized membrane protein
MKKLIAGTGAGLTGAVLMYMLDPRLGKRRRSEIRDKTIHFSKISSNTARVTSRDTANRLQGVWATITQPFRSREDSDAVLVERVRSAMGRVVSHPAAIEVTAHEGQVTLWGSVLQNEYDRLLSRVRSVPGVTSVEDELGAYKESDNVPDLQGGLPRLERSEIMQSNWAPAIRALAVTAGAAGMIYGIRRRDPAGTVLAGAGAAAIVRGITNLETRRLIGINAGRRAVDIQKTIRIGAPIDRVFSLWTNYENFPFFMSRVKEVRDMGNGRSHWVVHALPGINMEWDALVTDFVKEKLIAWKTEPGALVEHAGVVQFEPRGTGTRVQIRLSYNPPAGALGHAIAWLTGADPKTELDEDLVRMKSFVETGVTPHDAAERRRTG